MELKLPGVLKYQPQEVTPELLLNSSLNTVECLNHKVLSQLAPCPPVKLLVNSRPKVAMVVQPSLPANTPTPKCMVDLPVLEVMVVVNQHQMLNGVPLLPKTLETALVVTKDSSSAAALTLFFAFLLRFLVVGDMNSGFVFCIWSTLSC